MLAPRLDHEEHFVTGKNILVTGCTSKLGEALLHLIAALRPNKVFLACQSEKKGKVLKEQLCHKNVESQVLIGDMGTVAGAQRIARAMLKTEEPLHILVWNAVVWEALQNRSWRVTRQEHLEPRFCAHFTTNYLSMVILCTRLMPLLERSAPRLGQSPSRIIITGCSSHMDIAKGSVSLKLNEYMFTHPHLQNRIGLFTQNLAENDAAHAQVKLLQYMWAKKMAMNVGPKVAIVVYNPGQCETQDYTYLLAKKTMGEYGQSLYHSFTGMRKPEEGARVALWCADSPDAASANGKYVDFGITGPLKMNPPCELGISPSHNKSAVSIMDSVQVEHLWTLTRKFLLWQCGYEQQLQMHDHNASDSLDSHSLADSMGQQFLGSQGTDATPGHHQMISSISEPLPNLLSSKPHSSEKKTRLVEL